MSAPGFQFDLCARNAALEARGVVAPRLKKTGTTIAGIVFDVREEGRGEGRGEEGEGGG
jgi:hypothetical protein